MALSTQHFIPILSEVVHAARGTADVDTTLDLIARRITGAFPVRGCTIRVHNPLTGELDLRADAGMSPAYLEKGPVLASPDISEITGDDPVIIHDVRRDARVQYPDAAAGEGIRSIVSFPAAILGEIRMVLRIYLDGDTSLDDNEISMIGSLSEYAALALRQYVLYRQYFETFRDVSAAIHSGHDVAGILDTICRQITDIMGARGCIYWIVDEKRESIRTSVSHGFDYQSLKAAQYPTLQQMFRISERLPVHIEDARYDNRLPDLERLGKRRVAGMCGISFDILKPYAGVLVVYFGTPRRLEPVEVDFLSSLGEQGAIALQKALAYDEDLLRALQDTVETLALAIEAKDAHTHGHSLKVAEYSRQTALEMGLSPEVADTVTHAALLHDIGKIGIDGRILNRLGRLSTGEMNTLKLHSVIGERILRRLPYMNEIAPLVLYHHERYDGSGYPEGLQGTDIPLEARILCACDAFDTMISGRAKMPKMPLETALIQLRKESGRAFDPDVVEALVRVAERSPESIQPAEFQSDYLERLRSRLTAPPEKRSRKPGTLKNFMPGF